VEPGPDAERRAASQLAAWRVELEACYAPAGAGPTACAPRTAQGRALQEYIREFDLPRKPFDDLIDGVAMDLSYVRYPTFDALAEYCRRVASTVGLVCVEIPEHGSMPSASEWRCS
jgi:phytoene synthase